MPPLFELLEVHLSRSGEPVLEAFDLEVPDDGVTVLTGPSGSGKSTILRLCNRLLVPDSGTVRFRGVDVSQGDPCVLRRSVGMVFQQPTVFEGSVLDNLRAAEELDSTAAADLLGDVALDASFLDRRARDLSGGEQQRLCLARTLATSPVALLVDEGTSALDRKATRVLEELVVDLARRGTPVLWVTHDLDQAARIADHRRSLGNPS
ncbi:MAG: ATP-binding cassette domain-containing protein [Microthrixaceae bacterium]|nr:ATP-binding cassette domain-containing protein [Microthrixaceae bacterium]MCO5321765.1 ATP-binding cassette domain-containing protein [Microthrixaceae bacterium]